MHNWKVKTFVDNDTVVVVDPEDREFLYDCVAKEITEGLEVIGSAYAEQESS